MILPLLSPVTGGRLVKERPGILRDVDGRRWPVVDGIPYLRVGRDMLVEEAVGRLASGDREGALVALLGDQGRMVDGRTAGRRRPAPPRARRGSDVAPPGDGLPGVRQGGRLFRPPLERSDLPRRTGPARCPLAPGRERLRTGVRHRPLRARTRAARRELHRRRRGFRQALARAALGGATGGPARLLRRRGTLADRPKNATISSSATMPSISSSRSRPSSRPCGPSPDRPVGCR